MKRFASDLLLLAIAIGVLLAISRGLAPVLPALRVLLHPMGLAAIAVAVLLVRLLRGARRSGSGAGASRRAMSASEREAELLRRWR